MSWLNGLVKTEITGNEQDSSIPDRTKYIGNGSVLKAMITTAHWGSYHNQETGEIFKHIEIIYTVIEGKYKNRQIVQKLNIYNEYESYRTRCVNQLYRLLGPVTKILDNPMQLNEEPTNQFLGQMESKLCIIRINFKKYTKKDGSQGAQNDVAAVWSMSDDGAPDLIDKEEITYDPEDQPKPNTTSLMGKTAGALWG